jgi:hypothetical protein
MVVVVVIYRRTELLIHLTSSFDPVVNPAAKAFRRRIHPYREEPLLLQNITTPDHPDILWIVLRSRRVFLRPKSSVLWILIIT